MLSFDKHRDVDRRDDKDIFVIILDILDTLVIWAQDLSNLFHVVYVISGKIYENCIDWAKTCGTKLRET